MVGVAGKSQACNNCRQRRAKCDLRRPACLKCIKSKRECTGYDRDVIFINRTPSRPSTTATSVLSALRAQQLRKDTLVNPRIESDLRRLFSKTSRRSQEFRKYAVELLEAIYLPKQSVSSSSNAERSEGSYSWAYHLTDLTRPSKSLDTSLFAFCLTQLHLTGTGNASLYQCLDQYNTALQYLYSDLDDSEKRVQEETLAAIVVLSTCELFVCPAENGWGVHARGIAEILWLRGPGMARTPAWRHLFSRMRIVCTLEALSKRQAKILENDIWRQIVTESGCNGALDEVYRMSADIPAILERALTLPSISDHSTLLKEAAATTHSILAMVKSLESWYDEHCKKSQTQRFWSVPSCAANLADIDPSNKVFPTCFMFESLNVAVAVVMYWSVATQLFSNVIQIYDFVQERIGRHLELGFILAQVDPTVVGAASASGASSQSTRWPIAEKARSIRDIQNEGTRSARSVCQSLEYFHRMEMGTYGGHATTYPTWSARQYFRLHPGHEREWSWIRNIHKMEGPGTRWGLSRMTFEDIFEPLGGWSKVKILLEQNLFWGTSRQQS